MAVGKREVPKREITVKVLLSDMSYTLTVENVIETYVRDNMYCVLTKYGIRKYPLHNIKIIEEV